jgi:hypothetical protein
MWACSSWVLCPLPALGRVPASTDLPGWGEGDSQHRGFPEARPHPRHHIVPLGLFFPVLGPSKARPRLAGKGVRSSFAAEETESRGLILHGLCALYPSMRAEPTLLHQIPDMAQCPQQGLGTGSLASVEQCPHHLDGTGCFISLRHPGSTCFLLCMMSWACGRCAPAPPPPEGTASCPSALPGRPTPPLTPLALGDSSPLTLLHQEVP